MLLSWIGSLIFHVAALGGMYLLVFPYVAGPQEVENPVTFTQIYGDVDATGTSPVPPADPQAPVDSMPSSSAIGDHRHAPSVTPVEQTLSGPLGGGLGADPAEKGGGLGGLSLPGVPVIGIGGGTPGGGKGGGEGLSLGGGGGVKFFGLESSAPGVRSIIYVVDRSGSMLSTFPAVRAELKRSIGALRRTQKFHVVLYNSGEPVENPPARLVSAIAANKQEFFEFLETIDPTGGTRPERALRRALALEPDLIYFLSDGVFDPELVERLNEWNQERKTKIYTVAYLDPNGRQLLESIARQHGGEFKFVSEDDLP